jgi:hypothetical protein
MMGMQAHMNTAAAAAAQCLASCLRGVLMQHRTCSTKRLWQHMLAIGLRRSQTAPNRQQNMCIREAGGTTPVGLANTPATLAVAASHKKQRQLIR